MKKLILPLFLLFAFNNNFAQTKNDTSLVIIRAKGSPVLATNSSDGKFNFVYTSEEKWLIVYGDSEDTINNSDRTVKVYY